MEADDFGIAATIFYYTDRSISESNLKHTITRSSMKCARRWGSLIRHGKIERRRVKRPRLEKVRLVVLHDNEDKGRDIGEDLTKVSDVSHQIIDIQDAHTQKHFRKCGESRVEEEERELHPIERLAINAMMSDDDSEDARFYCPGVYGEVKG